MLRICVAVIKEKEDYLLFLIISRCHIFLTINEHNCKITPNVEDGALDIPAK